MDIQIWQSLRIQLNLADANNFQARGWANDRRANLSRLLVEPMTAVRICRASFLIIYFQCRFEKPEPSMQEAAKHDHHSSKGKSRKSRRSSKIFGQCVKPEWHLGSCILLHIVSVCFSWQCLQLIHIAWFHELLPLQKC